MNFYMFVFLLQTFSKLVGGESNINTLASIFGCTERKNVTVFGTSHVDRNEFQRMMKYLNAPCSPVFIFVPSLMKVLAWKEDFNLEINKEEHLETVEYMEDHARREGEIEFMQILLIFVDIQKQMTGRYLKTLELLNSANNWFVIVVCNQHKLCPTSQHIPINQIVPTPVYNQGGKIPKATLSSIRDLVKNPKFNKFALLKFTKLENTNVDGLKCLDRKFIHIFMQHVSLELQLMEKIAKLSHNVFSNGLDTEIILYLNYDAFWDHFMVKNGLENTNIRFVYGDHFGTLMRTFAQKTDDVYVIENQNGEYESDICTRPRQSIQGRKSFVFYSTKKSEWGDKCKQVLTKVSFKRMLHFQRDDSLLEEVIKASCMGS